MTNFDGHRRAILPWSLEPETSSESGDDFVTGRRDLNGLIRGLACWFHDLCLSKCRCFFFAESLQPVISSPAVRGAQMITACYTSSWDIFYSPIVFHVLSDGFVLKVTFTTVLLSSCAGGFSSNQAYMRFSISFPLGSSYLICLLGRGSLRGRKGPEYTTHREREGEKKIEQCDTEQGNNPTSKKIDLSRNRKKIL